MIISYRQQLSE